MRLFRPSRLATGAALLLLVGLTIPAAATPVPQTGSTPRATTTAPAPRTLVLYDTTGTWGWLGDTYVSQLVTLTGHLGAWVAHPVTGYVRGELSRYQAVVYLGSTYDEPIPTAFLDDVLAAKTPVLWANDNIWQLANRAGDFSHRYGFVYKGFDHGAVDRVLYRGTALTRDPANPSGVMDEWLTDPAKVTVLATASRTDGSTFPWALRSGNLTYVGEVPLSYVSAADRYLAFADLLYDALAPAGKARHEALLRAQDVGHNPDPARLRAVVEKLYGVPATVAAR
jgi:uncharacterized protein YdaL